MGVEMRYANQGQPVREINILRIIITVYHTMDYRQSIYDERETMSLGKLF
jgi:hypothetical protein